MIRRSPGKTVARRALIGAIALLVPALAGCEAGQNAPTLEFHPASNGAHAVVGGTLSINNAFVLGPPTGSTLPAGSSAGFFVALHNGGQADDTLVSVTASGAQNATIEGGPVSLPANRSANLTGPQPQIVLSGLAKPLAGGQSIDVTLDFERAGKVVLHVPVEPQSFYYQTFSPPASPATP